MLAIATLLLASVQPAPLFAASPGHITVRVDPRKRTRPKTLTVFSDDKGLTYTVMPGAPWLQVTPDPKGKTGKRFRLTLDQKQLHPGRNEAIVQIGAAGNVLEIPVVAEVPRIR